MRNSKKHNAEVNKKFADAPDSVLYWETEEGVQDTQILNNERSVGWREVEFKENISQKYLTF